MPETYSLFAFYKDGVRVLINQSQRETFIEDGWVPEEELPDQDKPKEKSKPKPKTRTRTKS